MSVVEITKQFTATHIWKKCCTCEKFREVFKAFAFEDNVSRTRWTGRKPRPTFWCKECWTQAEEQTKVDREQRDREIAEAIAQLRRERI